MYYFGTANVDVINVMVNGCVGQFFLSQAPENSIIITWINPEWNVPITVDGFYGESNILRIAESVSLI